MIGGRNIWTVGMAVRDAGWIGVPARKSNTWLREGRRQAADLLFQAGSTTAYRPYIVLGVGESNEPVDHDQMGLMQEIEVGGALARVVASSSARTGDIVSIVGEFAAEDYAGSQVREAALFNDLYGGAALYRVVYGAAIPVIAGEGYVLRVQLDIALLGED